MRWLRLIWTATLVAAFFGPILAYEDYPSFFAFRILLGVHWGLVIIAFIFSWKKMKYSFRVREYLAFFFVWLTWALISLSWAPSIIFGLKHVFYLSSGFSLTLFTVYYFRTDKELRLLLIVNTAVLAVMIALGLWEESTGTHIAGGFPYYYFKENTFPLIGVFGHTNNFATYLAMYLPLFYVLGKYIQNPAVKILSLGAFLTGAHLIFFSTSRANMLALVLGCAVILLLNLIDVQSTSARNFLLVLVFLIVCSLSLFVVPEVRDFIHEKSTKFLNETTSVFDNWQGDSSIQVRKRLISNGLKMLKEYHYLGVGPGNCEYLMNSYSEQTFGHVKIHNWWMEVLVNYGVIIWILYLLFFGKMLWDLFCVFRKTTHWTLKMLAEAMIVSLSIFSLGVVSNGSMTSCAHMWIMYGFALSVVNSFREAVSPQIT